LYLITRYRVSRRSWITDIFIEEHNAQDALFASPNEDEVELVMQAQTLQSDFAAAEPLFDETSSEKPAFDKMPDVDESLETEDFLQSEKTLLDASATEEIQHPDETVSEVKESSEIQETPNTEELPETEDFLRSEKTLLDASATEEIQHPDETVSEVKES
jgi:hypothetical protein